MADQDFDNLLRNIQEINKALLITNNNIQLLQEALSRGVQPGSVKELRDAIKALQSESESLKADLSVQGERYQARVKVLDDMSRSAQNLKRDLEASLQAYQKMLSQQPVSPGLAAQGERYARGYTLPAPPQGIRPGESLIPHPTGYAPKESLLNEVIAKKAQEAADLRLNTEKNAAAIKLDSARRIKEAEYRYADSLAVQVETKRRTNFDDIRDEFEEGRRRQLENPGKYSLDANGELVSKTEQAERERLQVLQESIAAHKKYTNALKVAAERGFSVTDLKNVYNRGTDIDRLQFSRQGNYGVRENLDLYTNSSGRVTPGISNQFRTFGQGVVRDIGELTKWSLALAAVYGPLKKLQELTAEMIENQTKLAEATITVNSSFLDQGQIFDVARENADAAGESVTGVIDAFTLAYRAAGGGADQVERLSTAQNLLSDSLTLSKLSSLDQAQAIDTLAAALRQSNGDLNAGSELLDKWVRVTKVANVDLATLATGFAVVGDAAEAAGIGVDELNGIIAAVAETGIASGREAANITRSIVSGFQSDQARKELETLGVAVEDTTGRMRNFNDIMKEIYNLRQSGAIDDTQFSRLTLALGGGNRRQAAYASFIENYNRVFEVVGAQQNSQGEAQAALDKQLETVQTSIDKLGNAFSSLAQSLGTEGGFLGIITEGVDGLTALVNIFDELVSVLGKATPAMVAFIATSVALKAKGLGGIQPYLASFTTPGGITEADRLAAVTGQAPGGYAQGVNTRASGRSPISANFLGGNISSGITQGIFTAAIPALMNFLNKDDRFGDTKGTANIVGGIAGGIIGSLTGAGPIIGAAIGTSIADVFISKTVAYETDLFGYQKAPGLGDSFVPSTVDDPLAALKKAEQDLYKSVGFGSEGLGRFLSQGDTEPAEDLVEKLNRAIQDGNEKLFNRVLGGNDPISGRGNESILQDAGIDIALVRKAFQDRSPIQFTPENTVYDRASENARRAYDSALAAYQASQQTDADIATPFGELIKQNREQFNSLLSGIQESAKQQASSERLGGDLKGSEYAKRLTAIGGFDTKALQYYTALGEEFIKINEGVDGAADAFDAFNKIIVAGASDTVPEITSIVSEIQTLINLLNDPKLTGDTRIAAFEPYGGENEARNKLRELQQTGASLLTDVYDQTRLNSLRIPNVQGDINAPLQTGEYSQVVELAKQLQQEFYQGFLEIPDDLYEGLKDGFEEWAQIVEDSGDVFFQKVSEVDPQFFQQALSKLIEEGKIASQKQTPFGIQQLDITSQQGAGLQSQIDYFSQYLSQNFPQYEQNPEEFGVIFSDYVTDVLHGDNLAVKLALEKLVDIGQKQLDGQYNIPEGATFWVPLTAAYYRPNNEGGLGGTNIEGLDTNTDATQNNTNALNNLTVAFGNVKSLYPDYFASEKTLTPIPEPQRQTGYGPQYQARPQAFIREQGLQKYYESERDRGSSGASSAGVGFVETIKNALNTFVQIATGPTGPFGRANIGGGAGSVGNRVGTAPDTRVNTAATAKLDIKFESTTQLTVDGRILASVVKPYLAADLLKLEGSQGTITKRYVI